MTSKPPSGSWRRKEGVARHDIYHNQILSHSTMIQNMGRRFKTSSRQMLLLCGIVLGMASMAMQSCSEAARDDRPALCGNWESVEGKPDVLIYKEGKAYKVTVFKRKGLGRELKPQTYLLQMENGNLFMTS